MISLQWTLRLIYLTLLVHARCMVFFITRRCLKIIKLRLRQDTSHMKLIRIVTYILLKQLISIEPTQSKIKMLCYFNIVTLIKLNVTGALMVII